MEPFRRDAHLVRRPSPPFPSRGHAVHRIRFGQLPLFVRIVVGIAIINVWVSFEEFIVDRVGLWKYMPGYRVGQFCVWDLTVVTLVITSLAWVSWRDNSAGANRHPSAT